MVQPALTSSAPMSGLSEARFCARKRHICRRIVHWRKHILQARESSYHMQDYLGPFWEIHSLARKKPINGAVDGTSEG